VGYQNANQVAVWHGYLPGASFKVLIRMALSSRDRDTPPRYHAGPGPLLLAIGRREVEPGDASVEAERARAVNAEMLRRAVTPLRDLGLVSYAVRPARGRTPEYWLHLEPRPGAVDNPVDYEDLAGERPNDSVGKGPTDPWGQTPERPNDPVGRTPFNPTDLLGPEMNTPEEEKRDEEETNPPHVGTSLARRHLKIANPIDPSDHDCIRGWLKDADGNRGTARCPVCHPTTKEAS